MTRVLLLLPALTYRAEDFLDAARTLGVEVVIASDQPQTLAEIVLVDFNRPDEVAARAVELDRRQHLDAVLAVDDQGVAAAEAASTALALPGNRLGAAQATRDKSALRAALSAAGVSQPAWALVAEGDSIESAAREIGLPCVIKPLSLSASRGVIRADDMASALAAAVRTRAIVASEAGPDQAALLVERYVPGAEVALEALAHPDGLQLLAIFDKPDPLQGPFFEETIYVTPSRLPQPLQQRIYSVAAEAAAAVGIWHGPVHAELRTDGEEVWLIELAARSIGGHCGRILRFGSCASLEELILRQALGAGNDRLPLQAGAAGVMMLPTPLAGILEAVEGQEQARAIPGIVGLEISIVPGRLLVPLPEGGRYLGFLYARGDTPEQVEASLREASALLVTRVSPPE